MGASKEYGLPKIHGFFFHHNTGKYQNNFELPIVMSINISNQCKTTCCKTCCVGNSTKKEHTYFGAALIENNETKTCEANQSSWRISQLYKKTKTMLKRSHDSLLPCQIFLRWNSSTSNPVTHHLSVAFLPGPCRLFVQTEAFNKKHVCSACANKTVQKQVVFEKLKASHTHTHTHTLVQCSMVLEGEELSRQGHLTRRQAVNKPWTKNI